MSILLVSAIFIFVTFSFFFGQETSGVQNVALADGKSLITVYADGQKKTVATDAKTIGEALKEQGVQLGQGDVSEPAADTPINQPVLNVNVYRAYPATIVDGNKKINTLSGYRSPRQIVEAAGVKLYDEDKVSVERSDNFSGDSMGQEITIARATPVNVTIGGKTFEFRSWKKSVRSLLAEKGIDLQPTDQLNVDPEASVKPNMQIVISRLTQNIISQMETINPDTQYVDDPDQPTSYQQVQDPGAPGQKLVTYAVSQTDGKETGRNAIDTKIIQEAKPKVIVRGTKRSNTDAQSEGWVKLRFCESGGNYANKRNPLYRGAYQFDFSTWNNYGGYYDPADAPADVQDAKALETYRRRGASPWPLCGRFLR